MQDNCFGVEGGMGILSLVIQYLGGWIYLTLLASATAYRISIYIDKKIEEYGEK